MSSVLIWEQLIHVFLLWKEVPQRLLKMLRDKEQLHHV